MSIIKRIFGIRPSKRTDVPNGLRGTGVLGGNGIFDEYFNQILFEIQADHIVDTEANVKLTDDPRGTCYYNSTSSEFQDSADATVTFSDGDKIAWRGLDTITSDIDISTIDDLEHVMFQGVTIALGSQTLSLGENQRGELKYSGTASALSGSVGIGAYEDFKTKNLIINVQNFTTIDADADNIIFVDQFGGGKRVNNINETFTMPTDLMSGTSEKASTWYQMWLDSEGVQLLVPDIESVTDSTTAGSLEDSTADFVTDKVSIGDIVYNITDLTQTTVSAVTDLNTLALTDDIFVSGETYKIRMLSPTGLGTVRARIGAAYNNVSSHLDDSTYTQIQEEKKYDGDGVDFATTSDHETTAELVQSIARVYQVNDWTGAGFWFAKLNTTYNYAATYGVITITYGGMVFKNIANYDQPVLASSDITAGYMSRATLNTGIVTISLLSGSTDRPFVYGDYELERKPTFAK